MSNEPLNVMSGPGQSYTHWTPRDHSSDEAFCTRMGVLIMEATRIPSGLRNQIDRAYAREMKIADIVDLTLIPSKILDGIDLNSLERGRAALEELEGLGIATVADMTELTSIPEHYTLDELRVEYADIDQRLAPLLKFAKRKAG